MKTRIAPGHPTSVITLQGKLKKPPKIPAINQQRKGQPTGIIWAIKNTTVANTLKTSLIGIEIKFHMMQNRENCEQWNSMSQRQS